MKNAKNVTQAIQWLVDNSTEGDEMKSLATTVPGTFTTKWGVEVCRKVSKDANSGV